MLWTAFGISILALGISLVSLTLNLQENQT